MSETNLCYGVHDPTGPQIVLVQGGKVYRHDLTRRQLYNLLEFASHAVTKDADMDISRGGQDHDGKKCCGAMVDARRQARAANHSVEYGRGPVIVWDR